MSNLRIALICFVFLITILSTLSAGCAQAEPLSIRVICAGSLMIPFQALENAYEAKNPDVDVLIEGHGSIQVIRQVTELHREADVVAVADHSLIPLLMYDVMADDNQPYASWTVRFASNRLGIAYVPESRYARELSTDNWYSVLSRPDVRLGFSDPRFDSLGYRALMLLELARNYYRDDSTFEQLVLSSFDPPLSVAKENRIQVILVPELVRPKDERVFLRAYSVQLLALLQAREIDYAFEYESVARQYGLEFLELPAEIDLSSNAHVPDYEKVAVRLNFQRFATVTPSFDGQTILYGVTIPHNAVHYKEAVSFLEFLLGPDGHQILSENYQPALVPAEADDTNKMPAEMRLLIK